MKIFYSPTTNELVVADNGIGIMSEGNRLHKWGFVPKQHYKPYKWAKTAGVSRIPDLFLTLKGVDINELRRKCEKERRRRREET